MEWVGWTIIAVIPASCVLGGLLGVVMYRRQRDESPEQRQARREAGVRRTEPSLLWMRRSLYLALGFPIAVGMIVAVGYGVLYVVRRLA